MQVKNSIKADKQKYMGELATIAEKAASEGNIEQLYDTPKKLAGKYSKPEISQGQRREDNHGDSRTEEKMGRML